MMSFPSKEPIDKGWSKDKKYCVSDEKGNRYLLRLSGEDLWAKKKREFELMTQVYRLGVPMCQALELEIYDGSVYFLQSWIDGRDVRDIIDDLSDGEQYSYGFEAGRILKLIHTVPAPEGTEDWSIRFNNKISRILDRYSDCSLKHENGELLIDFVNRHRYLLDGRPSCYQHGDYHVGNMMLDKDKKLCIIDFDRDDFGDPWEEFNRIVWCVEASPLFATGMINGYFDNEVPLNFWQLLALYISVNALSSLPWSISYGEGEIEISLRQGRNILLWYDNMKNPIPTWYKGIM